MKKASKKNETGKKILVVDDELVICNMLKKFLAIKGYEVSTVLSGEEAIKKVKEEKLHFVLLDIRMPGMDGIEVLKRIKEINKNIPVVVMISAVNDNAIATKCIEMGAVDYITKPLGLEYLENVLTVKLLDLVQRK
ncbi:MAG: response regulator [Candidatus Omnitrophota bacterium]